MSIVTDQFIRDTIFCKLALQVTDDIVAVQVTQFGNFYPFGVVINTQQVMCTIEFEQVEHSQFYPMVCLVASESPFVLWVVLSGIRCMWNTWTPYLQSEKTCQA